VLIEVLEDRINHAEAVAGRAGEMEQGNLEMGCRAIAIPGVAGIVETLAAVQHRRRPVWRTAGVFVWNAETGELHAGPADAPSVTSEPTRRNQIWNNLP